MSLKSFAVALCATVALSAFGGAHAATVVWTTWDGATADTRDPNGSIEGQAGAVGVSYDGEILQFLDDYPSWGPPGTFNGGDVDNAPPVSGGIIRMVGGGGDLANVNTITFSQAVLNPVFAIWSLGQLNRQASFVFDRPFSIQAGGPSNEYSGTSIIGVGNTVFGIEGNGVIRFTGPVTSISWTNPQEEDWYGFTVGYGSVVVPEPGTWALMIVGFGAAGAVLRRRRTLATAA